MDTVKVIQQSGGGNPYTAWIDFLWNTYLSNPKFWGIILLILFLMLIARVFVFDNKKLKVNSKSWFYPATFLFICAFCVWLKSDVKFEFSKQYTSDFLSTLAATFIIYTAVGHKLMQKVSSWAGKQLGLSNVEEIKPPTP
jgi:hypothetical protein